MKTKKLLLGFGLALLGTFAHAQNGLESIIVEKYYVSNAADAAGSVGTLPVGSVTYRIYADMLPGYKFQALYGVPGHELKITTTTSFFNNEDYGSTSPNGISVTNTRKNTVMLDSWFSTGGNAAGKVGVLKTEDTDGALVNSNGLLQNNNPGLFGNPLTTHDGMIAGTPEAVTFVGFTTELDVFDGTSQAGGSFSTTNGSIASLSGTTGPTATNRVLLGQFTTNGVFGFELNVQIGTPTNGVQQYVAINPVGAEITIPSLILAPNNPPTVSITAPTNGANIITGDNVAITATAADADGTVSSVKFYVGSTLIGTDNSSPYTANWTSTVGNHNITARAFDDDGDSTTSSIVAISVANNQAPTSVVASAPATAIVGDAVTISGTANDVDGTIAQIEFFVDNVSIGVDNSSPYTMNWNATFGNHNIKVTATDDRGASTTSSTISIAVANNIPPTASITSPTSSATYTAPQVVTIDANATDADGTVTQVEFFVNNVSIGVDASAPYSMNWTSVIGAASLTVKSTDDKGAITTSSAVNLSIADPNALPYKVATISNTCLPTTFCLPVVAQDTIDNVIGYDMVMNYDKTKITPTGNITMSNALINPTYVDIANSIDTVNGIINITAYFNSNAPGNAEFNGVGDIFCVEFTKTANFGSVDTAIVSISSLQESYFAGVSTKLVEAGKYITYRDSLFNASLRFWSDNSPIRYNSANPNDYLITDIFGNDAACDNQSATAVQPDLFGNFTYNISNGLYVNIERDILPTTSVISVINGGDATTMVRLLTNDATFVPSIYQMIAMDVNTDGLVSAGDLSQLNQRTVLSIPEFKQAWNYTSGGISNGEPSKDWLFVDSIRIATNAAYQISSTFPSDNGIGYSKARVPVVPFCLPVTVSDYANCPLITSETYKGIMLGDVNGNYQNISNNGLLKSASADRVIFDLSNAKVNGTNVDVPVYVSSTKAVNSLDFAMKFNESKLEYKSVINNSSDADMGMLSHFNTDDRTLRFTSYSLTNYKTSESVVYVRFATASGKVTAQDLNSLEGYINGNSARVELNTTGINEFNETAVSIYPNPANEILNVVVTENAMVQLLDLSGREVMMQTNVNANDKHEINIQGLTNGVYMLKVYNDNFVSMKKVVVNH